MMNTKNYNSIDVAKLFMAVCVVAIHTDPLYGCAGGFGLDLFNQVISWAVPFFFICTGFLIGKHIDLTGDHAAKQIKTSALKMLKLYLLWSVIYLPPAIVERLHAGKSVAYNLLHYAKGLILNGEHYNSWILWYLLSSFYALLFISFLVKRKQSPSRILAIGCALFVGYLALNALCDYANMLPPGLQKLLPLIQSTVGRGKPLQGFLYIPIGLCLSGKSMRVPQAAILFVVPFVLSFFTGQAVDRVLLPITVTGLFGLIVSIPLPDGKVYPILRKYSTGIYFIHLYCWMFYYLVFCGQKTYGLVAFLVTTLLSVILTTLWLIASRQIRRHKSKQITTP